MQRVRSAVSQHKKGAISLIVVLGISAGLGMLTILPLLNGGSSMPQALAQGLGSFKTYSQMQSFIAANAKSAQQYSRVNGGGLFLGMPIANGVAGSSAAVPAAATAHSALAPARADLTGTKDQVKGVDEQ